MATDPKAIYMLKPTPSGDSIAINRTIKVVDAEDDSFVVIVTDRDHLNDPSGQTQTIVSRESLTSIDLAFVEMEKSVSSSLAEGFIQNPWSEGKHPLI